MKAIRIKCDVAVLDYNTRNIGFINLPDYLHTPETSIKDIEEYLECEHGFKAQDNYWVSANDAGYFDAIVSDGVQIEF